MSDRQIIDPAPDERLVLLFDKETVDETELEVVLALAEFQLRQAIVRLNKNNHPQAKQVQVTLNAWRKCLNEMLQMNDDWEWKPE